MNDRIKQAVTDEWSSSRSIRLRLDVKLTGDTLAARYYVDAGGRRVNVSRSLAHLVASGSVLRRPADGQRYGPPWEYRKA